MGTEETEMTPQVLSDLLSLVMPAAVPARVIATWTPHEREQAREWAAAEHLSASDNPVKRLPQPRFVARAAEICASPAAAQLAVEGWMHHKESLEHGSAVAVMDAPDAAQDAVTGLLALLGDRTPPAWQARALDILAAHPDGLAPGELTVMLGRTGPVQEELDAWLAEGRRNGRLDRPADGMWALAAVKGVHRP